MLTFFLGVALLVLGAGVAASRRHARATDAAFQLLAVAGCAVVALAAARALGAADAPRAALATSLPGGTWAFGIDPLSAVFLLAISIVGAAAVVKDSTAPNLVPPELSAMAQK